MNARRQAWIALVLGAALTRLGLSGRSRDYVRAAMARWIVLGGVVLIVLAAVVLIVGEGGLIRRDPDGDAGADGDPGSDGGTTGDAHTHAHTVSDGHDHGSSLVAWLLIVPAVVLFAVAPPSLGAFVVGRSLADRPARIGAHHAYPPLPRPVDGASDLTLSQFVERALYDTSNRARSSPVRLTGFVMPDGAGSGSFLLTRFAVACCAADAVATQVRVTGLAGPTPAKEVWVHVVGRLVGDSTTSDRPTLRAEQVRIISKPDDPYEGA